MTYLDTHVAVWLWTGMVEQLSHQARAGLADHDLRISPMAVLELQYLHEIGRLEPTAQQVIETLSKDLGLRVCDLPFSLVVEQALQETWTRGPFDRLIAAQAAANGAPLITKDETIRENYRRAVW